MSIHNEEEYPVLHLVAVFWDGPHAKYGDDAVAHVEDALIVYVTRLDGLQVRLTVYELELLHNFVRGEVFRQDEAETATSSATDVRTGRIVSCQSTNHAECYGELWQCANCGKVVCANEGTDNEFDLCDDCWAKRHSPRFCSIQLDDDVPF